MQMYFIAVVLPPELNEKVMMLKNMMRDRYNCQVGLKSPAHITLVAPFWMEEEKEEQLMADISLLSGRLSPLRIVTKDFSAFPPKTIFVAVEPNERLNEVKKTVEAFFSERPFYRLPTESRPFHPHITIATRDLHKKHFREIWPWFSENKFREEWIAEGLSLLRHNKKNWDVVCTAPFMQQDGT